MRITASAKKEIGINLLIIGTAALIFLCAGETSAQKPLSEKEKVDTIRLCIINPRRSSEWRPDTARAYFRVSQASKSDTVISIPNNRRWMSIKDEWYVFTYVDTSLLSIKPLHSTSCLSPFRAASHP